MKEWKRAPVDMFCGYCNGPIPAGTLALVWTLAKVKQPRVRCADCAGPAPPDLPMHIERKSIAPTMPFTNISQALPVRTRGALRDMAARREWMPYRDEP